MVLVNETTTQIYVSHEYNASGPDKIVHQNCCIERESIKDCQIASWQVLQSIKIAVQSAPKCHEICIFESMKWIYVIVLVVETFVITDCPKERTDPGFGCAAIHWETIIDTIAIPSQERDKIFAIRDSIIPKTNSGLLIISDGQTFVHCLGIDSIAIK